MENNYLLYIISGAPELLLYSENKNIAYLEKEIVITNPHMNLSGTFNITGNFLGNLLPKIHIIKMYNFILLSNNNML